VHHFKVIDLFKKEINMTYRGNEYLSTCLGATMTLIFLVFILTYSLISFTQLLKDPIRSISRYEEPDLFQSVEVDEGLNCAFGFMKPLSPEIGVIRFLYNEWIEGPDGNKEMAVHDIPTVECEGLEETGMQCIDFDSEELKNRKIELRGTFHAKDFLFLQMQFVPCTQTDFDGCKS
jgi:hypothetical protein